MKGYTLGKLVVLAMVALALEVTLLNTFSIGGAHAEALLILACFGALYAHDPRQGLIAAWTMGLIKDFGSAGPLGLHALLFLAAGWIVLRVRAVLFRESAVTQVSVAFIAAFGVNVVVALFVSLTAGSVPAGVILARTLIAATMTALLAPPALYMMRRVKWLVR